MFNLPQVQSHQQVLLLLLELFADLLHVKPTITQRRGPSEYKSRMVGAQSESNSPCAASQASECYNLRTHRMRVEQSSAF